jgi:DNA-binding transcriptional LysR family regulator
MGDGVACYWMTRFLNPFFARHPNIELKLFGAFDTPADKREIFDLHVHYYEPAESEPVAVKLGSMHFLPFASREYLRLHGVPRNIDDLGRHKLLDLSAYLADMGSWSSWSRDDAGKHTVLFTNLSACLGEAVRCGAGIALLADLRAAGGRRVRAARYRHPLSDAHFRQLSARRAKKWPVRATIDFLRNHVFDRKNMPWFRDAYAAPAEDWNKRLLTLLQEAAEPDGPRELAHRRRATGTPPR